MALKTARYTDSAEVQIDHDLCVGCGTCVKVCKGAPLVMVEGQVKVDQSRYFGCIGCGACVAVCPKSAITVRGRDMSPESALPMPPEDSRASYESLLNLMRSRRSVRDFASREIEPEKIEKLLEAATTAPMGLPPSDVGVLVFAGRKQVQEFRNDVWREMKGWKWMTGGVGAVLMRPFLGRVMSEVMTGFVKTAMQAFEDMDAQGRDSMMYDAPLALYFYPSVWADPADPIVAATYAMVAGQSLGLGSTMLGIPGIVVKQSRRLKHKYQIDDSASAGLVVIFGYPAFRYQRAIKRQLGSVRYWGRPEGS